MKTFMHHTKNILKKIKSIQEELKKNSHVEKFEMPDTGSAKELPVQRVEISSKSVAKATLTIVGILLLAYALYSLQQLLIIFFISLFFAAALDPAVDWLEAKRVPRSLGVILIFIFLLSVVVAIIGSMVPIIIDQLSSLASYFANEMMQFFTRLQTGEGLQFMPEPYRGWVLTTLASVNLDTIMKEMFNNFSNFTNQIKDLASGSLHTIGTTVGAGVSVAGSIASGFLNFILVCFLTFFMVVDTQSLGDFFRALFPKKYSVYISDKTTAIRQKIGAWMRGQLFIVLIMFVTAFIGLLIIGMGKYALTLALIFGLGEFIPYVGPVIFLAFSFPIALGMGLIVVIKLVILYAILQFVDGNIFVPAVMHKVVGLSPIVVLLVLIIGFQFLGIIGAIIAVPVTTVATIFLSDYMKSVAEKK